MILEDKVNKKVETNQTIPPLMSLTVTRSTESINTYPSQESEYGGQTAEIDEIVHTDVLKMKPIASNKDDKTDTNNDLYAAFDIDAMMQTSETEHIEINATENLYEEFGIDEILGHASNDGPKSYQTQPTVHENQSNTLAFHDFESFKVACQGA